MNVPRKVLLPCLALALVLVVPRSARATWIEGKVFCDDGDARFDAGDAPVDGVTIAAVRQHGGTTLTDTTGDAVPVSPAVPGYYRIRLPALSDTYALSIRSGLPPGAGVLLPNGGSYSVEIISGSGDLSNARKTRNFLLRDCQGATTTTIQGASTTSTTPTTGNTSTSTTPTTGNSSTSTTPTTGNTSTSTTPTTGNSSTSTTPTTGNTSTSTTPTTGNTSTSTAPTGNTSTTTTPSTRNSTTTVPGGIPVPPNRGDGVLNPDEECDDGNRVSGDGCDAACSAEDTAETWKFNLRVRDQDFDRLVYFTFLPNVPSALLGTAPVHLTLRSQNFQMLDADIPASAFKVKPQPTLAQPDGRLARAAGDFGIWRIRLRLRPSTGVRGYDVRLHVKGEMLPEMFRFTHLTAVIRIGTVVYSATDPMWANPHGKRLRYIHPVFHP